MRVADFDAKAAITSLAAWTAAESVLCSELAATLGFALAPAVASDPLDDATEMAMLPFSLVSERAGVAIAVGVDCAGAAALAEAMFGSAEVEPAAIKDMMRELANVADGDLQAKGGDRRTNSHDGPAERHQRAVFPPRRRRGSKTVARHHRRNLARDSLRARAPNA